MWRQIKIKFTISSNSRGDDPNSLTATNILNQFAARYIENPQETGRMLQRVLEERPPNDPTPGFQAGVRAWMWHYPRRNGQIDRPHVRIEIGEHPRGGRVHMHFSLVVWVLGAMVRINLPEMRALIREAAQEELRLMGVSRNDPEYVEPGFYLHVAMGGTDDDDERYEDKDTWQEDLSNVIPARPPLRLGQPPGFQSSSKAGQTLRSRKQGKT
jgi:hypothetical protein